MKKISAISMFVLMLIFFTGIVCYKYEIFNMSNSFQHSINRTEMHPLDSLRYKFL